MLSIQNRLLQKDSYPSAEVIKWARINAEDLFEVKVDIIRQMTALDPEGDWPRLGDHLRFEEENGLPEKG